MSHCRDACSHVAKRSNDEGLRLEAGRAPAASKGEHKVSHFLRGLLLSVKDCVGKQSAHARAFVNEISQTVVEILRSVEDERHEMVFSQPVLGHASLGVGRVSPSRDVRMLPWIDAATNGSSPAARASDDIQSASSSRSKKYYRIRAKRSTQRRETLTMQTQSYAAKATSGSMPFIDLERHCK